MKKLFCNGISHQTKQRQVTMILNRVTAHTSDAVAKNIKLIYLPPACPELNPAERFFKELKLSFFSLD